MGVSFCISRLVSRRSLQVFPGASWWAVAHLFSLQSTPDSLAVNPCKDAVGASQNSKTWRVKMSKKTDKKQPLQSFKAFGIEASVWPPNSEYGETEPKIRIGRGYRDKDGVFRTSTYFSADELVVQIEQCMKALAYVKPELVESTMKSLDEIAAIDWRK
jgi:hypothetical protein